MNADEGEMSLLQVVSGNTGLIKTQNAYSTEPHLPCALWTSP